MQYAQGQSKTLELKKNDDLDAIITLWENMHFRYPNDYRILKELIVALCAKNDMNSFEKTFQYVILLLKNNENKVIENEVLDCVKTYMHNGNPVFLNQDNRDYLNQKDIDAIFDHVRKQDRKGKKVLLVDDASFMRKVQKELLEKTGYEVVGCAENGLEAIDMYEQLTPDIVIMDIVMPKMDGITAAKEIKSINPDACIFICSALSLEPMVKEAKEIGVDYFIAKPFNEEHFIRLFGDVPFVSQSVPCLA